MLINVVVLDVNEFCVGRSSGPLGIYAKGHTYTSAERHQNYHFHRGTQGKRRNTLKSEIVREREKEEREKKRKKKEKEIKRERRDKGRVR